MEQDGVDMHLCTGSMNHERIATPFDDGVLRFVRCTVAELELLAAVAML